MYMKIIDKQKEMIELISEFLIEKASARKEEVEDVSLKYAYTGAIEGIKMFETTLLKMWDEI